MGPTNPYEAPFVQHTVGGANDAGRVIVEELHASRGWMMLFVVLGGLTVIGLGLGGVAMTAIMLFMPEAQDQPFPMWIVGLLYFAIGAVYVLPVWRLYQLYAAINRLASIEPLDTLAEVARGHARLWRTLGWTFVGMIIFYVLIVGVAMGFAAFQATNS
ncbi:MAG: hypothetical protein IPG45_29730 [Deltaproteobacteria bacterium]|jgi:hypothetical protein|nr:hypothetical protein [Deltaproteobacteria bacterium]